MILAALKSLWAFAKLIPWQLYALAVLVFAFYGYGLYEHHQGVTETEAKYEAQIAKEKVSYAKQVAAIQAKQQEVITKTVIEYRDRIKVVKEKGDAIVKEIPVLVPLDSPLLSGGVRVAHDSAARGDLPDDPLGAAAAANPVTTTTLMATVAENYASCRADQERLRSLQTLVSSLEQKQ